MVECDGRNLYILELAKEFYIDLHLTFLCYTPFREISLVRTIPPNIAMHISTCLISAADGKDSGHESW